MKNIFTNASAQARQIFLLLISIGFLIFTTGARAETAAPAEASFLPVGQAFQLDTVQGANSLLLHFHVTPGYYLYHDRIHVEAEPPARVLDTVFSSEGEWKNDPSFGRVQVYHHDVDLRVKTAGSGTVHMRWQGCAEAGLCYPPQHRDITIAGTAAPAAGTAINTGLPGPFQSGSRLMVIAGLFLAGLALSFTPCIWPMLPILSGIIARQHTSSARRGLLLSLSYVCGMASTYALSGLLVGIFGSSINLPALFQQPALIIAFSLLFVVLALSMFGLYELQLPSAVQNWLHRHGSKHEGGKYIGTYTMGFFAALVVSPCVSAPLASVLLYISTTGSAWFGAVGLFVMGLGMGVPLLILGATEGSVLPKAGDWMIRVKIFFGLLMLGIAIYLLGRILPGTATMLLWAALAILSAVWCGALEPVQPGVGHVWKGAGVFLLVYGVVLILGAAMGGDDPLRPLQRLGRSGAVAQTESLHFRRIKTGADLDQALAAAHASHQPVLLDVYADWCVSCKEMERSVFPDPAVKAALGRFVLLQADVTGNDAGDQALLARFGLFGPPSLLGFRDGESKPALNLAGYQTPAQLVAAVSTL